MLFHLLHTLCQLCHAVHIQVSAALSDIGLWSPAQLGFALNVTLR